MTRRKKKSSGFSNPNLLSASHPRRCTGKRHRWCLLESHCKGQNPLFRPDLLFQPAGLSREHGVRASLYNARSAQGENRSRHSGVSEAVKWDSRTRLRRLPPSLPTACSRMLLRANCGPAEKGRDSKR